MSPSLVSVESSRFFNNVTEELTSYGYKKPSLRSSSSNNDRAPERNVDKKTYKMKVLTILIFIGFVTYGVAVPMEKSDAESKMGKERVLDEESYFSDMWKSNYNTEMLTRQPKWVLTEDQPSNRLYEVRMYDEAWWASSYTPCMNHNMTVSYGYLMLYLYFNSYNYQNFKYPLTYPILTKVEMGEKTEEDDLKDRMVCKDKFSQNFYVPISLDDYPATAYDESTTDSKLPATKFYVRTYSEDFASERCNEEARKFFVDLIWDARNINPSTWFCAQYEPGSGDDKGHFEVWYEAIEDVE